MIQRGQRQRVDRNQAEIVQALRKCGAHVQSLAGVGRGCPDLLVGYRGCWRVLEVKDGSKPLSQRGLTDAECDWVEAAARAGADVDLVWNVDEALAVIGVSS
jgi:hypothetical protein